MKCGWDMSLANRLRNQGFTLVEVMVAVLILAIALLSMGTVTSTVIGGNAYSSEMTKATTLAQQGMENVEAQGYSSASSSTENYGSISGYSAYKRVTTVTSGSPATGMKSVTVAVFWDADAHSVALKTILVQ